MARVLFLDPYHGPSHAALSRALQSGSRHEVTLLTLPPRKWKWRMRGAALTLEPDMRSLRPPDLLIVTDMLNLPETLAVMRGHWPSTLPVIAYFHENQLTYPVSGGDERDLHFGLANIYTALVADRVLFNSRFHRDDFLSAIPPFLAKMPDGRPGDQAARILERSEVLGIPLELPGETVDAIATAPPARPPWVLWNHRWEEDKGPAAFFRVMERLDAGGVEFRMAVAGQSFREAPACFESARAALAHRIAHWGYLPAREEYLALAARCRVVVSTALHEFYGLAVREAIAMGCRPLLPRRVVYPEMVGGRPECLYDTEEELVDRLASELSKGPAPADPILRREILDGAQGGILSRWDALIDELVGARR